MEQLDKQATYDQRYGNRGYGRQIAYRSLLLILLLLILAAMIYLYVFLTRPQQPITGPPKLPGVEHVFSIYGYGSEPAQLLDQPHGVNVDKDGQIYVADTSNHRILVFDDRGKYLFKFGQEGRAKGQMLFPLNMAIAPNGRVFVANMALAKILVFDVLGKQAKFVKDISFEEENPPIAVQVYGDRLYVTTQSGVNIMDLNGSSIKEWGTPGRAPGEFYYPNGVGVDKAGNIFVSDTNNDRIQIFDKDGTLKGLMGEPPTGLTDADRLFGLGVGLTLDENENVFVVDAFHHAVRVFDHDGEDLGEFGAQGTRDSEFRYPATIAYLGNNRFAVADQGNDRIQVMALTFGEEEAESLTQRVLTLSPWVQAAIAFGGLGLLVIILLPLRRRIARRRHR